MRVRTSSSRLRPFPVVLRFFGNDRLCLEGNLCLEGVLCALLLIIGGCATKIPSDEVMETGTPHSLPIEKVADIPVPEYRVGFGDTLTIGVLHHEEYSKEITVPPDEVLSLPRIPSYSTRGKSTSQIRDELAVLLSEKIRMPDVTVNLVKPSSLKVAVLGEVVSPGLFSYERTLSLGEVLALAHGVTETANEEEIVLLSPGQAPLVVSLLAANHAGYLAPVAPRSMILVPKSGIAKLDSFIDQFFTRTNPVLQYYLNVLDIKNYDETYRVRSR